MQLTPRAVAAVLLLVGIAVAAKPPSDDMDLQEAQDPHLWNDTDNEFIPYNGDRFDGFDWQLCKTLQRTEPGNLVISPIGIKLLLTMLYEGAGGKSAAEIERTLQLTQPRQQTRVRYSAVLETLQMGHPEYVLDIGTKLYADTRVTPRAKFVKILKYFYNTDMERVDFLEPNSAARTINTWVQGATNGRISKIISNPEDDLDMVKLMLVNVIFFKGTWKYPFPEEETTKAPFNLSPSRSVPVNYMRQTNNFYYYNSTTLNAQILRLPYMGKRFSMFVVLPHSPTGLNRMLETVTPDRVRQVMTNMSLEEIEIMIPRFKFDFTANMVEVLQKLGLNDIFSESADLQGVISRRQGFNLFVSNVVQKAAIDVNEKGTTAAVVTQISTGNRFGHSLVFNARHPFMFFIEDETTGTVLFVGKVVDPTNTVTVSPSSPTKNPTQTPTKLPTGDTIGTRFGEQSTETSTPHPEFYPININWGWPSFTIPNQNQVSANNNIRDPMHNTQPGLLASPNPFIQKGQSYPAIILYPVYIQGLKK